MSVTPQTNEPEVPEEVPAGTGDPAAFPPDMFVELDDLTNGAAGREAPVVELTDGDLDPARLEARVVQRLVRHVSPWSVLKVSALLYLSMYVVVLLAGIGLWTIAASRGLIGSFESFMDELLAEENFQVNGSQVLRLSAIVGIFAVVFGAALTVLFSIIFNLISDLTGGVRLSVVELETARPRRSRRD